MPKIVDRNDYRQKLLERSLDLFTRKGYHNINMKEIAAELGVSTGTLYHYFPAKENMLAEMLAWISDQNISEYYRRYKSIESIHDRFDVLMTYLKESGDLYEKTMLLAIDFYRNSDSKQWKEVYSFFCDSYTGAWSERLNITPKFARFLYIYFIGLSFHSVAFEESSEYNDQLDFLNTLFRPLIVDAPEDMEKAAKKIKEITRTELLKKSVSPKSTAAGKTNTKKAITERKNND